MWHIVFINYFLKSLLYDCLCSFVHYAEWKDEDYGDDVKKIMSSSLAVY